MKIKSDVNELFILEAYNIVYQISKDAHTKWREMITMIETLLVGRLIHPHVGTLHILLKVERTFHFNFLT
jgi:hypothetical protein